MKDIMLKKGDIAITKERGEITISFSDGKSIKDFIVDSEKRGFYITEIKRIKEYEILYKKPQEILDNKEKEYLRAVIRPFRNRVDYISKHKANLDCDFILIGLYDDAMALPYFEKNTMYKGMELQKEYTLEEWGL